MKKAVQLLCLLLLLASFRPDEPGLTWLFTKAPAGLPDELEAGDEFDLVFTAKLGKDWVMYSSDFKGDIGPQPTAFYFEPDDSFEVVGDITPVSPKRKKDRVWETDIAYFAQKAEFRQHIRLKKADYRITGVIKGQLCSEKNGVCVPFERFFIF